MVLDKKNQGLFADKIGLLESTLGSTIDGVVVIDLDFNVLFVNKTIEKWTGKKKEKIIGKHCREVAPQLNCDEVCPPKKTFKDGQSHVSENKITTADGVEISQLVSASPLKNDRGEIVGCVEVIKDVTDCKKSEEALRESEETFRTLSEESPNMIFINKGGRVVFANRRCEEIMGYSREEFFAEDFNLMQIIHPESRELVKNNVKSHLKGDEIAPYEYKLLTKDGKEIIGIHTTKLIDYEGERAILGIVTDISARKKAEELVRQHADEMAIILELSQRFISTLDLGTLLQTSIDESVKVTGLGTGAIYLIEGDDMMKLWATNPPLPPDFPEELRMIPLADHPHIKKAITTKRQVILADTTKTTFTPAEKEVTKLRNLRTILYVPLIGDKGALGVFIIGSIGAPCVISKEQQRFCTTIANETVMAVHNAKLYEETKKAEEKLRESEEFLTGIIENSGDAIITTDRDGKITLWSRGAEILFGYKSEDVLGKGTDWLYPDELKKSREKWQNEILSGVTLRNIRTKIYNSTKELIDINLTLSPLRDKEGTVYGTIGVSKNITDVINMEKGLHDKIGELEKWQKLTIGREIRMTELKSEIIELKRRLGESENRI